MSSIKSSLQAILILAGLSAATLGITVLLSYQKFQRHSFTQQFDNSWQDAQNLQVNGYGRIEYLKPNTVIQFQSTRDIRLRNPPPMQTITPEMALKIWTPQSPTCHDLIHEGGNLTIRFGTISDNNKPNGLLFVHQLDNNQYCSQRWSTSK